VQENMQNLVKYAAHMAYMLLMPHICDIFFRIFPACATSSDGESS